METAKAVVEVPSPFKGRVLKFYGQAGDVIDTGAPLVEFELEGQEKQAADDAPQPADEEPAQAEQAAGSEDAAAEAAVPEPDGEEREDSGTVVGKMQAGGGIVRERTSTVGGVKVTPAVRALARKMKVDLSRVEPSGADNVVTAADVRRAAEEGPADLETETPQPASAPAETTPQPEPAAAAPSADAAPAARRAPQPEAASGEWEPLRGTRRTMARVMSESQQRVVPTTLMDDADIHAWRSGEDITYRLLRALSAGAREEPGRSEEHTSELQSRMLHKGMDVGMAVDTPDGLFVARVRGVHGGSREEIRAEINRLKENVQSRSIPPEDLKDYTIMLSNFWIFAGRYATPIINPPCVAIVADRKSVV